MVPADFEAFDLTGATHLSGRSSTFSQLAAWAEELNIGNLRLDRGETFRNRFVLVWHERQASFSSVDDAVDEYQAFWQDFARGVCVKGPRVDDTLHLFPHVGKDSGTFWVVGGDGRLASHCANGLLYAGHRWQEVHQVATVCLQCGVESRLVEMLSGAACVHLGRPQLLDQTRLKLSSLRNPPLCVDTGEPHAVSFADELIEVDDPFGERFIQHGKWVCESWSDAGINWDLVDIDSEGLRIRTFERGVRRPTDSCGTGSAAAFFAAHATGRWTALEADVTSPGGRHRVSLREEEVWLQGVPTHHQSLCLVEFLVGLANC